MRACLSSRRQHHRLAAPARPPPPVRRAQVFLEVDDFCLFADEYADKCGSWPFFKVLVRKCCSTSFFGHGRPLYAIDIAILHTARNTALSIEVFAKYKSAMLHPSKYVGPLAEAIPLLRCASHV